MKTGLTAALFALSAFVLPATAGELLWYGQAAVKITSDGGKVILIDPFITKNPKTPDALKDLSRLGKLDLILVTHGHGDHVGDTAEIAKMTGAKVSPNADMGHTFSFPGVVLAGHVIRVNTSGPIHYGTSPPLKGTPEQFKAELGDTSITVVDLAAGQSMNF